MRQFVQRNKKYINLVMSYIKYEIMIATLLLIGSIIGLLSPMLFQIIIDNVLLLKQIYLLKYILLALTVCYVLGMVVSFVTGFLSNYLGQIISIRLRSKLMIHIFKLKMEGITESKVGDFIAKISEDVATITSFLSGTFVSTTSDTLNLLATGVLMLFFNVKLTIITVVMCIGQVIISKKFGKITRENQREIRSKASVNLSFLNNTFSAIKQIKAYRKEKYTQKEYVRLLQVLKDLSFKSFFIQYFYGTMMSFISYIGSLLILIVGIFEIRSGRMTVGMLFVFDTITNNFCQFANNIVNLNVTLQSVIIAFERINSIFDMPVESYERNCSLTEYNIQFEHMNFAYNQNKIFTDLNLDLKQGQAYVIVGNSGSGKSTLSNLIMKFYDPSEGTIRIGGKPLNEIGIIELRNKITLVFQDTIIINGTIEENIRYGSKWRTFEEVKKVSKLAGLHDFVEELPHKYNSMIEENGENLSGGQKQRICLARALLRETEIYIFDESLSALDKNMENQVFENIEKYLSNKTRIYITHNLDLAKKIPSIILIKDSKGNFINQEQLKY